MHASRQSSKSFWTSIGRASASRGHSAEWAVNQLNPNYTVARQWILEGHAAQVKRMARAAKRQAKGATPRLPDRHEP